MSKYQFRESDIYLPGTDIPRNRLGITEADLLQQAYQVFIAELQPAPVSTKPTSNPCTSALGASLYDWAGEYEAWT